jgi:hypothetical protein
MRLQHKPVKEGEGACLPLFMSPDSVCLRDMKIFLPNVASIMLV